MIFDFKNLNYSYNSLSSISPRALELHHSMHYKTYLDNLNNLLNEKKLSFLKIEDVIIKYFSEINNTNLEKTELIFANKIFNNAAQVFNHEFYWNSMGPNCGGDISKDYKIYSYIMKKFENFDNFIKKFKEISLAQFGSGWSWLVFNKLKNEIDIISTSNAHTPLNDSNLLVLLTIDVWEHAYYRDFENKRNFYLDKFFEHLINWKFAEENFQNFLININK